MTQIPLKVEPGAATERLDVYLAAALDRTRSQVQRLLRTGLVTVDGRSERASYLVQPGDTITVRSAPAPAASPAAPDLPVLYEDEDLLVIDKPAGLSVHPGAGLEAIATVADFARSRTTDPDPERPGIVHRLDRDTSGLLIIAKTEAAKTHLQAAFKNHQIHKTYRLLVVGRLSPEAATIRLPLSRDPARPLQQAVVPGGREAITAYETKANFPGYTLVEARPKTGRTHQLRTHFAALGHPVAGDIVYGPPKRPLGLKRQFLHAAALEFTAPSGAHISLESPLPADLATVLRRLEPGDAQ
jgi:23S rRNA pseudouridine1911/1915/1917 synthase